jgi:hypothetical protein
VFPAVLFQLVLGVKYDTKVLSEPSQKEPVSRHAAFFKNAALSCFSVFVDSQLDLHVTKL